MWLYMPCRKIPVSRHSPVRAKKWPCAQASYDWLVCGARQGNPSFSDHGCLHNRPRNLLLILTYSILPLFNFVEAGISTTKRSALRVLSAFAMQVAGQVAPRCSLMAGAYDHDCTSFSRLGLPSQHRPDSCPPQKYRSFVRSRFEVYNIRL